jgi:hypothetical protein
LLRCDVQLGNHWLAVRALGVKSNRSGLGARIRIVTDEGAQIDEVRSGGSYYSQNDLRVHFGLGQSTLVRTLEVRWPSGAVDTLANLPVNQFVYIREGAGLVKPGEQPVAPKVVKPER